MTSLLSSTLLGRRALYHSLSLANQNEVAYGVITPQQQLTADTRGIHDAVIAIETHALALKCNAASHE